MAQAAEYTPLPSDVVSLGTVFAFTPHAKTFASQVAIQVPFSGTELAGRALYTADKDGSSWSPVQNATQPTPGQKMFTATVDHFSYFTVVAPAAPLAAGPETICARHTLAGKTSVSCWGSNFNGVLGTGSDKPYLTPTPKEVFSASAVKLAFGNAHACRLESDGRVYCWGGSGWGQLGRTDPPPVDPPFDPTTNQEVLGFNDAVDLAASGNTTCVIRKGGGVSCWGATSTYEAGDPEGAPLCQAPGQDFPACHPKPETMSLPSPNGTWQRIVGARGMPGFCAISSGGDVACWGHAGGGRFGTKVTVTSCPAGPCAPPGMVPEFAGAQAIAIAGAGACALMDDRVRCVGDNTRALLGTGDTTAVDPGTWAEPIDKDGADVVAGDDYFCVRMASGTVRCWGMNFFGAVGVEPGGPVNCDAGPCLPSPTKVSGLTKVTALIAGAASTCAKTADGEVWCWGDNMMGQLGKPGTSEPSATPLQITFSSP